MALSNRFTGLQGFIRGILIATVFVNLVLPKAGFYVGSLPITLSYFLLGFSGLLSLFAFYKWHLRITYKLVFSALFLFLFFALALPSLLSSNLGLTSSLFVYTMSILIIPLVSLIVGSAFIQMLGMDRLSHIVKLGLIVITLVGILSFFLVNIAKRPEYIGIPYLTYTGGDYLQLILHKNINRGGIYKAVSTYNNGNLLGINVLMWLPLGMFFIQDSWLLSGIRVLLLATLSRTVWLGWAFAEVGAFITRRATWGRYVLIPIIVALSVAAIFTINFLTGQGINFLFDATLGNRAQQLQVDVHILPSPDFTGIGEIVYASILRNLGVLGLLFFVWTWSFPVLVASRSKATRWIRLGCVLYFFFDAVRWSIYSNTNPIHILVFGWAFGKPSQVFKAG